MKQYLFKKIYQNSVRRESVALESWPTPPCPAQLDRSPTRTGMAKKMRLHQGTDFSSRDIISHREAQVTRIFHLQLPVKEAKFLLSVDNRSEALFCHADPTHKVEALSKVRQGEQAGTLITLPLLPVGWRFHTRRGKSRPEAATLTQGPEYGGSEIFPGVDEIHKDRALHQSPKELTLFETEYGEVQALRGL